MKIGKIWLFLCLMDSYIPRAAAQAVDREALYRHLHKSFSTPPDMKFTLKDLQPSKIPGFLSGELKIEGNPQPQIIHISKDGRFYFLSPAYPIIDSKVPGIRTAAATSQALPLPVHLSSDGKYLLYGEVRDLRIDPDAENRSKIKLEGLPGQGPENAPITLVEYSDLQCHHCKAAHEVLERELPAYKGKVRWVYKYFPLTHIHPWAYTAAIAAACAGQQSAKAELKFHSYFFSEQASLKPDQIRQKSMDFAQKVGLKLDLFTQCLDQQQSRARIEADIAEAKALGVRATPTLFINGRQARGYDFPTVLRPILEEMLAEKAAKAAR
jgi:protein-disulfide isomerase